MRYIIQFKYFARHCYEPFVNLKKL